MPWTLLLSTLLAATTCPVARQNIPVTVTPLSPAAIGAVPDATDEAVRRLGPFAYQGNGVIVRSDDPRFADLMLDQRHGLRHRCGNPMLVPSPWNGARTASSADVMEMLRIPTGVSNDSHSGATEAKRHGVRPVLAGHVAGPSWPVFHARGTFFLGLMYPTGDARQTRLVAFRDAAGTVPALTLGLLPMRLETVHVIPGLHESNDYLYLAALRPEAMGQITLRISPEDTASIAAILAGEKEGGWSG